jgi:hypothetical protein
MRPVKTASAEHAALAVSQEPGKFAALGDEAADVGEQSPPFGPLRCDT